MSEFYSCPLASGSSGNCYYIENIGGSSNKRTRILVDAGLSLRALKELLNGIVSTDFEEIDAIFVTHEHIDHIKGLSAVVKKYHALPVYMHEQSYYAAPDDVKLMLRRNVQFFETGCDIDVGSLRVSPFKTSHDSVYSVGFTFAGEDSVKEIGLATDLGMVTKEVAAALVGCRSVYLESNYDIDMLRIGRYPVSLKRRIMSGAGHLSNGDCADFLPYLVRNGAENITLCHLSEENNTHSLAYNASKRALDSAGVGHLVKSFAIAPKKAGVVRRELIPVEGNLCGGSNKIAEN